jgi:hypothetical protein
MDFYQKYLKYKNKYLSLRNLYGGMDPIPSHSTVSTAPVAPVEPVAQAASAPVEANKKLKLLSEISNFTKRIFFINNKSEYTEKKAETNPSIAMQLKNEDFINSIFKRIPNFINNKYIHTMGGFAQDPLIQLYNIQSNVYNNYINKIGWITTKQTYVPIHLRKTGATTATKSEKDQNVIFPPEEHYNNIELHDYIITNPNGSKEDREEFIKGGNFISSPPTEHAEHGVLFYIEPITKELRDILDREVIQPIIPLQCSFKFKGVNPSDKITPREFRHVDEIMTFLPYGKGLFKVWFYDILDKPSIPRDIYANLKREQRANLEKISNALFNSSYEDNTERFFIVPIDIGYNSFIFPHPSVFNLSYIEVNNDVIEPQLFLSSNQKDYLDPIIIAELKKIRSYLTNRPVIYHILDTYCTHGTIKPGGNIHCLIKQEMEHTII